MQKRFKSILPDKTQSRHETKIVTQRSKERDEEERQYDAVILKRTDEFQRHADDVLEFAIKEGSEQLGRPVLSLFLSAIAAGLILGFTALTVAVVTKVVLLTGAENIERVAVALVYPFGFVICVMSGAELFTEHTATAVYPVLDRKASIFLMLRLWIVVLVGNLIGALCSAGLLVGAEDIIQAKEGYIEIGRHLVKHNSLSLMISSLLAGWLMALGGWLLFATPLGTSQIVCIYIVTFLIGIGRLHHSIAGAVEMFSALLITDDFTLSEGFRFLGIAIVGNLIGGSIFVALLNYAHIRHTRVTEEGNPINS